MEYHANSESVQNFLKSGLWNVCVGLYQCACMFHYTVNMEMDSRWRNQETPARKRGLYTSKTHGFQ